MMRMTIHLTGVKTVLVETRTFNEKTKKNEYVKKKKLYNTVTFNCKNEDEGLVLMNNMLDEHKKKNTGVKAAKHYFTNIN